MRIYIMQAMSKHATNEESLQCAEKFSMEIFCSDHGLFYHKYFFEHKLFIVINLLLYKYIQSCQVLGL